MTRTKINSKEQARQYAIEWQEWQGEVSLSYKEVIMFSDIFRKLGKKFGLLREFKENGII